MTETTTPTEGEEVIDSSADNQQDDSALLDDDQADNSAVEDQEDTTSENDDSDQGSTDSTDNNGEDEPNKVDSSLKKFAKSQGFDPENLSEGEIKALKIAHNNQKAFRKQTEQQNKGAVENNIKSIDKDSDMSDREYFEFRMQQRDMVDNVRNYWTENPEDQKYEAEAAAILAKEQEQYGDEAMFRLAGNMPRLMREAKFAAGAYDPSVVSEKARREERERLRKIQEGSADGMNATTTDKPSKSDVTSEWIKNEYDPDNPEHRKKMDEFTASRGKIY